MKNSILITLYLVSIIAANLLVAWLGPAIAVVNAFVLIGLDLTVRDHLHDTWQGRGLWIKILLLIGCGSALSYALNRNAGPVALASFVAFLGSGVADTLVYWWLGDRARLLRVNGSNVVSAGVDSFLFPLLAFGWPLLWWIFLGQWSAKIIGGFIWSLLLEWRGVSYAT